MSERRGMRAYREIADNATTYDVDVLQQVAGELATVISEHQPGATKDTFEKMLATVSFELMMREDELSSSVAS